MAVSLQVNTVCTPCQIYKCLIHLFENGRMCRLNKFLSILCLVISLTQHWGKFSPPGEERTCVVSRYFIAGGQIVLWCLLDFHSAPLPGCLSHFSVSGMWVCGERGTQKFHKQSWFWKMYAIIRCIRLTISEMCDKLQCPKKQVNWSSLIFLGNREISIAQVFTSSFPGRLCFHFLVKK